MPCLAARAHSVTIDPKSPVSPNLRHMRCQEFEAAVRRGTGREGWDGRAIERSSDNKNWQSLLDIVEIGCEMM